MSKSKLVLSLMVFGACGDNGANTPADSATDSILPDTDQCVPDPGPATVIYLNRTGGSYQNGAAGNDSSNNITNIVPAGAPTVIPAATVVEADFTEFLACLNDRFKRFNVTFTETDPTTAEHIELVMIDTPQQIGAPNGTFSVAPFAACGPGNSPQATPKGIPFLVWGAFGTTDPGRNVGRCEAAAQTIASTFGLDHAFSCPDLMTFLSSCGAKSFTDENVPCGEFEARNCSCGGPTQNSFRYLSQLLGPTCL